jgi:adenosine deaminase
MNYNKLPKCELHVHLEGAAPPEFIRQLAKEQKIDLTGLFDSDGDYFFNDFNDFLNIYDQACKVLNGPEEFYRLVIAALRSSAQHGVIYTEFFVSPDFCGGGDILAWRKYLAAMEEAAAYCEVEMSVYCRFILTPIRHLGAERARVIADIAQKTKGGRLTGFGMGGDETFLTPKDFSYAFDMAREAGYRLTNHAGEIVGANSVLDSLEYLKVERIGHGVRAIEDLAVVQRLVEENITLEVNPGSNIFLGFYKDLKSHPIQRLCELGVQVTVSTDDPPFFKTNMTKEYSNLANVFNWKNETFFSLNMDAVKAAFCDDKTKEILNSILEREYA